jgi:hypothetical protein
MASQTHEQKLQVIATWEASEHFPRNPLLLHTEHNFRVLQGETTTIPDLTVEKLVAAVARLTSEGKLEYGEYVEPVAPVFVLQNPDTLVSIETKAELKAFIDADPRNMRRLLFPDGKAKSVEAEKEINRLLNLPSMPKDKSAGKKQREEADKWGIKTYGSDKTELDKPLPRDTYTDEVERRNKAAFAQAQAARETENMIQNFSVNSYSGKTDWGKTHLIREELRAIKVKKADGSVNHVLTANAVGTRIRELTH